MMIGFLHIWGRIFTNYFLVFDVRGHLGFGVPEHLNWPHKLLLGLREAYREAWEKERNTVLISFQNTITLVMSGGLIKEPRKKIVVRFLTLKLPVTVTCSSLSPLLNNLCSELPQSFCMYWEFSESDLSATHCCVIKSRRLWELQLKSSVFLGKDLGWDNSQIRSLPKKKIFFTCKNSSAFFGHHCAPTVNGWPTLAGRVLWHVATSRRRCYPERQDRAVLHKGDAQNTNAETGLHLPPRELHAWQCSFLNTIFIKTAWFPPHNSVLDKREKQDGLDTDAFLAFKCCLNFSFKMTKNRTSLNIYY